MFTSSLRFTFRISFSVTSTWASIVVRSEIRMISVPVMVAVPTTRSPFSTERLEITPVVGDLIVVRLRFVLSSLRDASELSTVYSAALEDSVAAVILASAEAMLACADSTWARLWSNASWLITPSSNNCLLRSCTRLACFRDVSNSSFCDSLLAIWARAVAILDLALLRLASPRSTAERNTSGSTLSNNWPWTTESPSSTYNSTISPDTSGLMITSVSGYILPLAETVSLMVLSAVWAISTSSPSGADEFLYPTNATIATNASSSPNIIHFRLPDFFFRAIPINPVKII